MRFGPRVATACRVALLATAAFCGLIAVYVVLRRDRFLTSPQALAFFLGVPLLVGVGALAVARLAVERQLKIILVLFSTGFSLLVVELSLLGVELFRKGAVEHARAELIAEQKRAMPGYDDRTSRQFFIDHWKEGDPVFPRIYQLSSRTVQADGKTTFPTSSLSERKIVECFADGAYKVFSSDEFGFANPPGIHARKAEIVIVGDSFTAGDCVSTEEDIGARLRLTHPDSVNLGVGGAGPIWELANLVEYGLPLKPEYVFWLYYEGNDFADMQLESRFPELTQYLDGGSQGLRERKPQVDAAVEKIQTAEIDQLAGAPPMPPTGPSIAHEVLRSLKLPRLRMRIGLHGDTTKAVTRQVTTLERSILRARELVEAQGAKFVVVYVPDYVRFVGGREDFNRDFVLAMLAKNGVKVIDLLPALEAHPDVLSLFPHRQTGHFDADGYAFIADRILDEVPAR